VAERISAEEHARLIGQEPSGAETAGGLTPEEGLEILGPEPETLETSAGPVHVGPMRMRQVKLFMPLAKDLIPRIVADIEKYGNEVQLTQIYNVDPDGFTRALAVAADCTTKILDEMLPDEFARVATKVFVSNFDFFVWTLPRVFDQTQRSAMAAFKRFVMGGAGPSRV